MEIFIRLDGDQLMEKHPSNCIQNFCWLFDLNKGLDKKGGEDGEDDAWDQLEKDPVEPDVDVVQRLIRHLINMMITLKMMMVMMIVRRKSPWSHMLI